MDCQNDCPYVMPCGDCFACSRYPDCEDKPSNTVCEQCKKCFNDNKEEEM